MLSSAYQDMVNLTVGLPIWRRPGIFMDFAMWEHCTFDSEIFICGNIYYSNSIIITYLVQLISYSRFESVFPAYFGTEISLQHYFRYLGTLLNTRSNSS
jgi:hypothetical protein